MTDRVAEVYRVSLTARFLPKDPFERVRVQGAPGNGAVAPRDYLMQIHQKNLGNLLFPNQNK